MKPLVLDFDASVKILPGEQRIGLHEWQEALRFGCRQPVLDELETRIASQLAMPHGPVFMGSGDYHHVSHLLIRRFAVLDRPLQVVVFDNHPDNMRYPFGIHCGSWVHHVSRLPFVAQVHVLGITSPDVEAAHAWENHLRNLRADKVRYWCVGSNLDWMPRLGINRSQSFKSVETMLEAFSRHLASQQDRVYLSIDKDVLSVEDARTNWDQGVMRFSEMLSAIGMLGPRLVGCDVTGEVSVYQYRSRFKRILSGMDGQAAIDETALESWQNAQQEINLALLRSLSAGLGGDFDLLANLVE